jgi:hypothetical protein
MDMGQSILDPSHGPDLFDLFELDKSTAFHFALRHRERCLCLVLISTWLARLILPFRSRLR